VVVAGYCAWLAVRRQSLQAGSTPLRLALVVVVAWILAVWAYYGLYISPMVASAQALLAPSSAQAATVRWPGGFADLVAFTVDYVVTLLPLILAVAGFAMLVTVRSISPARRRALLLITLWLTTGPLFFLINYKVDMIGKHLFFVMLPVALAGGVALCGLARQGRWGSALAAIAFTLVGWQGLVFWVERLVRASG
jgi:hypothetical protein